MTQARAAVGLILVAGLLAGCGSTGTPSQPVVEQPSEFFTLCTRDVVTDSFPPGLAAPQPGDDIESQNNLPQGEAEVEHRRSFRGTTKEANEGVQKLQARLRDEARQLKAQVGEVIASPSKDVHGLIDQFTFTYTADDRQGTVKGQVLVVEKPDKDQKMPFTLVLTVTEKMKPVGTSE